jgi:hypothetical protein
VVPQSRICPSPHRCRVISVLIWCLMVLFRFPIMKLPYAIIMFSVCGVCGRQSSILPLHIIKRLTPLLAVLGPVIVSPLPIPTSLSTINLSHPGWLCCTTQRLEMAPLWAPLALLVHFPCPLVLAPRDVRASHPAETSAADTVEDWGRAVL